MRAQTFNRANLGQPLVHDEGPWRRADVANLPLGVHEAADRAESRLRRPAPVRQGAYRSLLVPLDGTPLGERALPLAVSIARRCGAALRLVHVHQPMESTFYPQAPSTIDMGFRRQQMLYLSSLAQQIEDAAQVGVTTQYLERREIVDGLRDAADRGVDLVVLATQGYGWFARLWRGSTVDDLIDQPMPPLLVLRGDGLRAAIAPNRWLRRMLLPLDGSLQAEEALAAATKLGGLYDARYSLLTVTSPQGWEGQDILACDPDGTVRTQPAARHYLRRVVRSLHRNSLPTDSCLSVSEESVAQAIISRARSMRADCIAMSPGPRGGLKRWLKPSVTRRVLRLAETPVLIVPGAGTT